MGIGSGDGPFIISWAFIMHDEHQDNYYPNVCHGQKPFHSMEHCFERTCTMTQCMSMMLKMKKIWIQNPQQKLQGLLVTEFSF